MLPLAFSTNAFKKNTLDEALEAIASIGYAGVEIMADVPHALPSRMDAAAMRALAARLRQLGLAASNVNAFTLFADGDTYHPTWIESDRQRRRARVEHTIGAIRLAGALGAKSVSLQPGGPMIGTGLSREMAGERFAEGIAACLAAAVECDVTLAIEPEPGLFIESAGEYLDFKQRFFADDPRVRMNCDIGHLYCVGDDPAEVIRSQPEQIAHVHVEDIGANRVHQHLMPGKGAIDFGEIFEALRVIDYRGWVTVELYPYETTAAGVARGAWEHLSEFAK